MRKILSLIYVPTENPLPRTTFEELKHKLLPQYSYIYKGQEYPYLPMILKIEELMEQEDLINPLDVSKEIKVLVNRHLFSLYELEIGKKKEKLNF